MYRGEVTRCLDRVELRETLELGYEITDEEYRSEHGITGEIRGVLIPDRQVVRSRTFPPSNPIQAVVQSGTETDLFGQGYPGTDLIVAVTRVPPMEERDEQFQDGFREVAFNIDGMPENGTIHLDGDWDLDRARDSLSNDERKVVSHKYEVDGFPSEQLPIVVRGELRRDAREYRENLPTTVHDRETVERRFDSWESYLQQFEGLAVLSVEIEYRQDHPERDVGTDGWLSIETFRMDFESTFPNMEFGPRENYTYNPEQQRVEWRGRKLSPDNSCRYDVYGRMEDLLDLGRVSASIRGIVHRDTLTGTRMVGLYDRTGRAVTERDQVTTAHGVILTGDIEIDPRALRSESRKVTDATVTLNDTPFDAFDRLQRVCEREGITIRSSQEPSNPEPVANKEGVVEISKGEKGDGDDVPGELEIKREYGDRGVVYAHILVYGQFTSISRDREISQSSGDSARTEDRLVRADQGALGDRGKSTIDIRARSVDSELNAKLIQTVQDGLGGASG